VAKTAINVGLRAQVEINYLKSLVESVGSGDQLVAAIAASQASQITVMEALQKAAPSTPRSSRKRDRKGKAKA
jgi:fructose-1-phosphate kinase PfkB-like protein